MTRKIFLTTFVIFALSLALPAFGAVSNNDFLELCKYGSTKQIADAIKSGANINAKDKDGLTALMFAAWNNQNTDVIAELVRAGADVNAKENSIGWTPLMFAVMFNKNPEVIKPLLNAGADANAKSKGGKTALDYARDKNNAAAVKILEPTTAMNDNDFLELCKSGSLKQVVDAIKAGANVNAKNDEDWTALMFASWSNKNPEVITELIKYGADVNAKNRLGFTPLMHAARNNKNPEVIKVLLNSGADINAKSNAGKTSLEYARRNRNTEAIKIIDSYFSSVVQKSAEEGDAEAQYKFGMRYANGDGVPEDQWEAVIWLRKAAQQGHRAARNELAKRGIYE